MINETIQLGDGQATLTAYIHDKSNQWEFQIPERPAIIVLPGGAYSFLSDAEGEPVCLTFLEKGYNTFLLRYSVGDDCTFPRILEQVSLAIWEVRRNAKEWNVNPDGIVLMGFSAGACIAGMSATQWNTPGLAERLGVPAEGIKPNACVIGYGCWDNTNTIQKNPAFYNPHAAKIAKDCTPELDLINYAGPHMPPLFIWHNRYDQYVPAVNPLMIAGKMLDLDLPFELHLFQGGQHGMSVCNALADYEGHMRPVCDENPNVGMWVPLCVNWIDGLFDVKTMQGGY